MLLRSVEVEVEVGVDEGLPRQRVMGSVEGILWAMASANKSSVAPCGSSKNEESLDPTPTETVAIWAGMAWKRSGPSCSAVGESSG